MPVGSSPMRPLSADGVEVAQEHHVPGRVSGVDVGQDVLDHALGAAVGVGDDAFGHLLGDGADLRGAVNGGGGGEDDVLTAVPPHGLRQHHGAVQVVTIVPQGLRHRLPDRFQTGEVHTAVEGFCLAGEKGFHLFRVAQVHVHEGDALPHDLCHPAQGFLG